LESPLFLRASTAAAVDWTANSPYALAHEPSPRCCLISHAAPLLRAESASAQAIGDKVAKMASSNGYENGRDHNDAD